MEYEIALKGKKLAPLSTKDERNKLPQSMLVVKPYDFFYKLLICFGIVGICYFLIINLNNVFLTIISIVILGLIYAHMVELQHECLHEGGFNSRKLNRLFGVLLGLFMLSSHSHYKHDHLLHHSYLGTSLNREFFNYRFKGLNNLSGFLLACFSLGRYIDVFKNVIRSLLGKEIPEVKGKNWQKKIRHEYMFMSFILILTLIYTFYTYDPIFIYIWYIPVLVISEMVHFLIEFPEHYGLNTLSNANIFENTRTIKTNRFWQWFTNGNNLHTAHHYHHGVPMCYVQQLHGLIKKDIKVWEESYFSFYMRVIKGKITYNPEENCMTR